MTKSFSPHFESVKIICGVHQITTIETFHDKILRLGSDEKSLSNDNAEVSQFG